MIESIVEPRDQDETLQADWASIAKVLVMIGDRVEDGGRIWITRPAYFSPTADVLSLTRSGMYRLIDNCLKNAEVVDA